MRGIKLSLKLPVLVILAVLLTASAASLLGIFIGGNVLQAEELKHNADSVQTYASAIGYYLANARSLLETTADLPEMVDGDDHTIATLIMDHSQVFEYVVHLQADGTVHHFMPHDLEAKLSRRDLSFTAWYKELMRTGKTVVSDLHISPATQRPTVVIATPVRDSAGKIIGISAGGLNLEELARIGRGGAARGVIGVYGYVTDSRGLIIAHQGNFKYVQEQTDFSSVPAVRAALTGQQGATQFFDPIEREEQLGAYLPLAGTGWAVVYVLPARVALAPLEDLTRSIALISAGLVVLLGLVSLLIARQVTVPLAHLTAAAEAIGAGDFARRIAVQTGDEIEQLAGTFNRMASRLGNFTGELEAAVQKRTGELSALYTIDRAAAQSLDLMEILNAALDKVLETLEVEAGGILLLEPDGEMLRLRVHRGFSDEFVRNVNAVKIGEGLAGRAAAEQKPVTMDIADYPSQRLAPFIVQEGLQSLASTPLLSAGKVVGALNLATRRVRAFPSEELELLTGIGQLLGAAVQNAKLYQQVQQELAERKHAEEELRETRDYLDNLIQYANAPIIVWSPDRRITRFNAAFERLTAYAAADVIGKELAMLFPEASRNESLDKISRALGGEYWQSVEIPIQRKDGETRLALWNSANIHSKDDRILLATIAQGQDITERKQAELDLKRSNEELQQFAYVASHDLQEPLRMVASYTQLLARRYSGKLDSDADDFIKFAVDGANRMQRMINDLLMYSRVGTRGKPLAPTSCEAVLQDALTNLKLAIEERRAVITHDPLPLVMADEAQLIQLFQNLIGNAIKFHVKPPRVHISARKTSEVAHTAKTSEVWVFSIHDNGIGIDPQYSERIFIIFQRLHSRGEYPGSGIGLALCKKIVERHGGRIWLESKPGAGSTFFFTLPIKGEQL